MQTVQFSKCKTCYIWLSSRDSGGYCLARQCIVIYLMFHILPTCYHKFKLIYLFVNNNGKYLCHLRMSMRACAAQSTIKITQKCIYTELVRQYCYLNYNMYLHPSIYTHKHRYK